MSYVLFNTRVLKMSMVLCSNLHLVAWGFVLVLRWHLFLSGEDQTGKAGMGRDINSSTVYIWVVVKSSPARDYRFAFQMTSKWLQLFGVGAHWEVYYFHVIGLVKLVLVVPLALIMSLRTPATFWRALPVFLFSFWICSRSSSLHSYAVLTHGHSTWAKGVNVNKNWWTGVGFNSSRCASHAPSCIEAMFQIRIQKDIPLWSIEMIEIATHANKKKIARYPQVQPSCAFPYAANPQRFEPTFFYVMCFWNLWPHAICFWPLTKMVLKFPRHQYLVIYLVKFVLVKILHSDSTFSNTYIIETKLHGNCRNCSIQFL